MDVEQRARAFIASRTSNPEFRQDVLDGDYDDTGWFGHVAAALTPPEGYVLVPVEPTEDMTWAPSDVEVGYPSWAGSRDCCTTDEAKAVWAAMVAARPEVTL